MTKKITRRCWQCPTWQEIHPTDQIRNNHRVWVCPVCGTETLWVMDPDEDGSFAEQHRLPGGGFSVLSMLSDPDCLVYSKQQRAAVGRPVGFIPPAEKIAPKSRRGAPPPQIMYFAVEDKIKSFFAGPAPNLNEVLVAPPRDVSEGDLLFVEDDQGNRTHRWHWGRRGWVELMKK